ncbi:MAG: hypothetical protein J6J38_00345 [Lachnospiraceae bacterium]|nr:hypothetical protein [Lachnospiraceae bacterium]
MERRVGFVGCYSHDVILLLAKVLSCVGKKVLLVDKSKRHTLRASVPVPEGIDAEKVKVEYDGIFYGETESTMEERALYDVEIIDFGMEFKKENAMGCTELIVVTDMLLHHIHTLIKTEIPGERVRACIIRDTMESPGKREKAVGDFLKAFPNRKEFFLPPDFKDMKNRYVCETMNEYSMKRASSELQEAILQVAAMLCPGYEEKEIRQMIRNRERRKYR